MTNPIPTVGALPYQRGNIPQVVPFTIRENPSLMSLVEGMRTWIRDDLVPFINDEIKTLIEANDAQNAELISMWEQLSADLIEHANQAVIDAKNSADDAEAAQGLAEAARDLAEMYASQAEDIQDQAISGILDNAGSDSRNTLDSLYTGLTAFNNFSDTVNNILNGRLSEVSIESTIKSEISETIINVRNFGLIGDGSTDDSSAFSNLVSLVNSSEGTKGIYFPGGTYVIGSGHVFNTTVRVYGDSPDASNIVVKDGDSGDVFTFNGRSSTIENLNIDGNADNVSFGDTVVFNAGYPIAQRLLITSSAGTAIRIGKNARAICARLSQVMTRLSTNHAIHVSNESTDGLWSDCDLGTSGLSGVRLEASSQNLSNIHSWGNGWKYVEGDGSGFIISTSGHQISNCQAETNYEHGFNLLSSNQNGSILSTCKSWANGWSGFNFQNYHRASLSACTSFDNGMRNVGGLETGSIYSGFRNFESNHLSMSACKAFDREVARDVTTPNPEMSKDAVTTQVWDYCEDGSSAPHSGAFTANSFIHENGVKFLGVGSIFEGNRVNNVSVPIINVTGNTLPVRANHSVVSVTGSGSFNALPADIIGRVVTLMFTTTGLSIFENGNIKLLSPFGSGAGKQITLQWNGSKWVEISRV